MLTPSSILIPLLTRSVAVFSSGRNGQAVRDLVAAAGGTSVVYDERDPATGRTTFTAAEAAQHGLVVFSPGFAPDHRWLQLARTAGGRCLGELDFAALFWRGRLVAITGTNGKTTLTEFLTHALLASGRRARATGNIGYPLSRLVLDAGETAGETLAVCEVSSFQAETLRHFQPEATLWTNFAEDHLERHHGLADYFSAKWKLVERTVPGAVFLGTSVQGYAGQSGPVAAAVVGVASEGLAPDTRLGGTVFESYPQRENFELALAWWRHAGWAEADLYAAAQSFRLGRHRLACVQQVAGVNYWNDSKATNFHAVEAALRRFDTPVVLIAGGKAKGGDLGGFVRRIASRVQHVVLIGDTRVELAGYCAAQAVPHSECRTLAEAVQEAAAHARPGGHVLLSPGFASFDMFKGYDHRGEAFEQLVHGLLMSAATTSP